VRWPVTIFKYPAELPGKLMPLLHSLVFSQRDVGLTPGFGEIVVMLCPVHGGLFFIKIIA
jgi:hypothetical protein